MKSLLKFLIAVCAGMATLVPASAQTEPFLFDPLIPVYPMVNCTGFDPVNNSLLVHFGYINRRSYSFSEFYGVNNYFSRTSDYVQTSTQGFVAGLPDTFESDVPSGQYPYPLTIKQDVFTAPMDLNTQVMTAWVLYGSPGVATVGTARCAGGACWDLNLNGSCDVSSEDKNGDGKCTPDDCKGLQGLTGPQGPQGQPGATGPQGPKGDPGPAKLSLVTVAGATASDTTRAACSGTQSVVGGGGSCSLRTGGTGKLGSSAPDAQNGWTVSCSLGTPSAYAVCGQK